MRRGRLKATYTAPWSQLVLQIDASPKGLVLKDAEVHLIEPWTKQKLQLVVGQMKWPFGFEVTQSSGVREAPERARVTRTLLPDERDRGAKIASTAGKPLFWEVGVYNGTGVNTNDNNFNKDVVGRVRYSFSQMFDLGLSGYFGETFVPTVPASGGNPAVPAQEFVKNRYGADFQLYLPGIQFRGEYIQLPGVDGAKRRAPSV